MYQFKCFSCARLSSYKHRVAAMRVEMIRTGSMSDNQTRTYECDFCRRENELTNSAVDWMAIDFGIAPE